jgi:hypothetical protein
MVPVITYICLRYYIDFLFVRGYWPKYLSGHFHSGFGPTSEINLADLRVRMNYYGFPIQSNLFYINVYNIELILRALN